MTKYSYLIQNHKQKLKMKLSKIIPTLILSSILCLQAKTEKQGLSPELEDLFQGPLLDSEGKEVSKKILGGKTIGIYFSAHWCPPCRSFTPKLVKFRDANKKDFEVVFVSSDRSPKAQMDYMKGSKMKWYTMPHRSDAANALSKKYEVRGIPSLVIVSPDGKTITKNGRNDVSSNPKGAIKNWKKNS